MPRRILLCAAVLLGLLFCRPAISQHTSIPLPEDAKFSVSVDFAALKKTGIGAKVFSLVKAKALEELKGEVNIEKIRDTLGFDPFEEVRGLTLIGFDFEEPEKMLRGVLHLGKTTGNLEGLALGLPGYESVTRDGQLLHSAPLDDMGRIYAAIHTDDAGLKSIVVGRSGDEVIALLKSLGDKPTASPSTAPAFDPAGSFLRVNLLKIPTQLFDEEPAANVIKLLQHAEVLVGEDQQQLSVSLIVIAKEEKQAEQLQQLAQGLAAAASLFVEVDNDQELKMLQDLAKHLKVERKGNQIRLNLPVPAELVTKLIEENLGH